MRVFPSWECHWTVPVSSYLSFFQSNIIQTNFLVRTWSLENEERVFTTSACIYVNEGAHQERQADPELFQFILSMFVDLSRPCVSNTFIVFFNF
jgi:hypothetical protein